MSEYIENVVPHVSDCEAMLIWHFTSWGGRINPLITKGKNILGGVRYVEGLLDETHPKLPFFNLIFGGTTYLSGRYTP